MTWTEKLNALTKDERNYTTETAPSWHAWIFAESIRRTSTMSVFLAGIYSLVKLGYCTMGEQVSAHSFTAQRRLWDAASPLEWERAKGSYDAFWTPQMNFDHVIMQGSADELDDFGMVMLITYKGQEIVDHWLALSQKATPAIPDLYQSFRETSQKKCHG